MASMYCCERFEKRPAWIVSPAAEDHVRCAHQRTLEPGVKVNSEYYRNFLLMEKMLPAIWGMASDFFIFQQDSAPAHRRKDTIALLRHETPNSTRPELWPANSPDLNPVDYRIWGLIQKRVYQTAIGLRDIDKLKERLIVVWAELKQSVIDKAIESQGGELAFKRKDITSNILLNETLRF